jgi:hypothetical protein
MPAPAGDQRRRRARWQELTRSECFERLVMLDQYLACDATGQPVHTWPVFKTISSERFAVLHPR